MDIIALQKFIRVSPKKMRPVADVARKLSPQEAIDRLPFLRKGGSEILLKVIKSAMTNARQKGLSDDSLLFKEIQIGEGPRLKRGRAASRGRWHPYKRRMSHIRVVLTTRNVEARNTKSENNDEKKMTGMENINNEVSESTGSNKTVKSVRSAGKTLKAIISKRKKGDTK